MTGPVAGRVAIRCIRPDLTTDRERDEREMTATALRHHLAVDTSTVTIDPDVEGPWTTVALAIARIHATHVIVPNLEHVKGIERQIRARAGLISVTHMAVTA